MTRRPSLCLSLVVAAGRVAFRLGPGTRPEEPGDKPLATCRLAGVELRLGKSQLECENTTLDGRPWQAPANGP